MKIANMWRHVVVPNFDDSFLGMVLVYSLLLLCLSATGFYCYAIYAAIDFFEYSYLRNLTRGAFSSVGSPNFSKPDFHPPVSILKPICGLDREAYENLASFCQQNYPEYQIVFVVRSEQDAGVEVVRKIICNFPDVDIQLIVSDRTIGTNLKVSNLANGLAAVKHSILIIADSDIRVGSDYLLQVIQPLRDSTVGVVTCLYRSLAPNWVAALEAVATSTEFHPSVLVARKLDGMKFALGSTIVIRADVLEASGGFLAIADYLSDDFLLGKLSTEAGYKVVLSNYIVEHVLAAGTITDSLRRQLRWLRGIRVSRPWGHLGLIFTHGTATSLLFLMATQGSLLGWAGLVVTWSARLIMGWVVGVKYLEDPVAKKFLWLVPLRDLISFALWCYSFVGNVIEWRGRRLNLVKDGKLLS